MWSVFDPGIAIMQYLQGIITHYMMWHMMLSLVLGVALC